MGKFVSMLIAKLNDWGLLEKNTASVPLGWSKKKVQALQEETARSLGRRVIFRDRLKYGDDSPEMVIIPAGKYLMGLEYSMPAHFPVTPQLKVTIGRPFALGRYIVTVGEFRRFVKMTGYSTDAEKEGTSWVCNTEYEEHKAKEGTCWRHDFTGEQEAEDDMPVVHVSWNDASAYCEWLTVQSGNKYRLPSETEQEYGIRAGTATRYWWGDGVPEERVVNAFKYKKESKGTIFKGTSFDAGKFGPSLVRRSLPNPFGLHDTIGNVWEWGEDVFIDNFQGGPTDGSAWRGAGERGDNPWRVIRGGSWANQIDLLCSASRLRARAADRDKATGFRLAMDFTIDFGFVEHLERGQLRKNGIRS